MMDHALACTFCGTPATITGRLGAFVQRYQPDELLLALAVHDHGQRRRALELAMALRPELTVPDR